MKSVLNILRPMRFLLAVCISALLILSYAVPTLAAPMRNEPNPEANQAAKKYEDVSRKALETDHPGPTMKESEELTNKGGINEVQGTAGAEDMKRPSNSGGVPTVEKDIKNVLEKVQDKVS